MSKYVRFVNLLLQFALIAVLKIINTISFTFNYIFNIFIYTEIF